MRHPLEHIPHGRRLPTFLALVSTSAVVHRQMQAHDKTHPAPHGTASFAAGGSVAKDLKILASWDGAARHRAVHNLRRSTRSSR